MFHRLCSIFVKFSSKFSLLISYHLLELMYASFVLGSYVLEFDDDEEDGSLPQRSVPFHKVVPLPEGHRQ